MFAQGIEVWHLVEHEYPDHQHRAEPQRCLARLRRHPAIAGLIDADDEPIQCEDASLALALSM
jgi:hypothetical protein